ncbi:unnamed protein product [Owenia fusiformis]|uniref:Uncharacterized protein n=1 Tax=Owenia fusiformis TaxID=6347 RepID=A0A8J1UKN0_OWEFU|nr:unnamed protein product [Owenia fusiformis]
MGNIIFRKSEYLYGLKEMILGLFPAYLGSTFTYSRIGDNLEEFVEFISVKTEVHSSGKYTQEQLEEHTDYVERFVQDLCADVGAKEPAFKSKELVGRGSHYEKTKVVSVDECDFLIPLALSDDENVQVENLGEDCFRYGGGDIGYGVVTVRLASLKQGFADDMVKKYTKGRHILSCKLVKKIQHAIKHSLESRLGSKFKGYADLQYGPKDTYPVGVCSMNEYCHGPSIWLRLGTPLTTTDIDLCFCIERFGRSPRTVMVPLGGEVEKKFYLKLCKCFVEDCHWMESIVDPPNDNKHVLTRWHKQVFICMKFISHILCTVGGKTSSFTLKTLVLKHQVRCKSNNVGECFEAVVRDMCGRKDNQSGCEPDTFDITLQNDVVYDVDYPGREIYHPIKKSNIIPAFIWFLQHVKYTKDTDWWCHLLDEGFPESVPESGLLWSFIQTYRKCIDQYAHDEKVMKFEWPHYANHTTKLSIRHQRHS